ncbi:MAG: glycosyltransferase family 1 protein [Rhodobiaceae bacterium]|nr:glycosyltransferase family 1 protein [Rhodobiaceae bacterium]
MTDISSDNAERKTTELRIAIVTDAAPPQVNGVVRTLKQLGKELEEQGHKIMYLTPDMFRTIPLPTYKEIRIALGAKRHVAALLEEFQPDAIHIATEGPLGLAARRYCLKKRRSFTTSFHTRFPEYLHARFRIPENWTYALVRRFHAPASAVMAATPLLISELEGRGFKNLRLWSRGVDTNLFKPKQGAKAGTASREPIWLYVGRVAVEKNIDAFLDLDLPGTKKVVGEGPRLDLLRKKYQTTEFAGALFGEELAKAYAEADCFVFPSKTDTFGLVLIEALASGTPVAAYPVQGPLDVIGGAPVGRLDDDLKTACLAALQADPDTCRAYAMNFSWQACSQQFLSNLSLESEKKEATTSKSADPLPAVS